jgi:hypothetical protein
VLGALGYLKGKGWAGAIKTAYAQVQVGKKPVDQQFEKWLYKVLTRAIGVWIEETATLMGSRYGPWKRRTIKNLATHVKRKPGPRTSPSQRSARAKQRDEMAVRCAKRYEFLKEEVARLRQVINERKTAGVMDEAALRKVIRKMFRADWVQYVTSGTAFDHLVDFSTRMKVSRSLTSLDWMDRELAVGILLCEEKARNPLTRFGPYTLYQEYILRGNSLQKKLSRRLQPST